VDDLSHVLEETVGEPTEKLATQERRFRALVDSSSDSTSVIDADGLISYQSPAISRLLGYRPAEVVGTRLDRLLDRDDAVRLVPLLHNLVQDPGGSITLDLLLHHRDGSPRTCEATLTNLLHDSDVGGIVVNMRDVTERRRLRNELAHYVLHDKLTGLPNRALFDERLRHTLQQNVRNDTTTSVLIVDLDGFKTVNDSRGHDAGDTALRATALRISACVRTADTVARLDGDEFGVILEGATAAFALEVARRTLEALRAPIAMPDGTLVTTASVGVATAAQLDDDPDGLARTAHIAMSTAKANGGDRIEVHETSHHADIMQLQADLGGAIERGELQVHFQPVVTLRDGVPVGLEALLRWEHPTRGMIAPDVFIPIAEASGQMVSIGRWVLREACSLAQQWFSEVPTGSTLEWISVNVSALQLADAVLIEDVADALRAAGLTANHLVVELTEGRLLKNTVHLSGLLTSLRALGVRIALDDVGTGYSSLSFLEKFPVDILKVDRAFVEATTAGGGLSVLARSIVDLSRGLHVQAIAEGIERADQARSFLAQGCALGQGFLFARPMPATDVAAYLSARQPSGGLATAS
jgi:diguanylate cyclase (GGDEF)-like protein/PAS domain S-box-containing protein